MHLHSSFQSWLCALAITLTASWCQAQQPSKLNLNQGDHIALIGNALADRMQHTGYFETLLHAQFPNLQLTVRNLASAGDEVALRHRSENFGSPEDWLTRTRADVIIAFFGYSESFQGPDGIAKFRTDLDRYLKETATKDFSGRGNPRIVLISPIADEKHQDPNFPDPAANNANLRLYSQAMAEVARANNVQFVDLFTPSQQLYDTAAAQGRSLTINGHYLGNEGDRLMAPVLFKGLFQQDPPSGNHEKLRAAINDKNAEWHARYRTIDGYNVYGGRSALAYQPGQGGFISDRTPKAPYISNYKVMQEEMSQRDVLTANRDKRVWVVAAGGDLVVDDSNLPPVTKVKTNKPGPNEDESHKFLSGEEAISKMTVHSGMKVNLFTSEAEFPELINPVQMAWDLQGRLWVSVWPNYPSRAPQSKTGDSLLVFEDTNGDGKADKCTHFIDDLNAATGFQFYKDGVLVVQAPDLWFVRDTDGDGKADWKERVLMGLDSADSHHTANAVCLDPGGSIYLSDGVFHRTQMETAYGTIRNNDAAIYRFEPRTGKLDTYIAYGFANPHGRVFDAWGNDFVTDATGNANYFGPAFSGYLDYPAKHNGMKEFWNRPSRPCPGTGILTSRHFPEEFQGNFLNLNVISFQGIFRVKVSEDGSGLKGETMENLISSTDPNFRPSAVSTGPDGAIYFTDWHNPIIGHMQHHLRDPNRNKKYGRIYRITYPGRPLLKAPTIAGQPIPALLELLKEPENQVREWAKIELGKRDSHEVTAAAKKWAANLDMNAPNAAHQLTEALWVHQWHNIVDIDLLKRVLSSSEPNARAAAGRVLCYWRDRVPNALDLFQKLALDEHPRVRLEAVRAASFFPTADAASMALSILKYPTDYYLDYTLKESLRQLDKWWRKAIADGQPIAQNNPAGLAYLVRTLKTPELLKLPKTGPVLEALLTRPDVLDSDRSSALAALASEKSTGRTTLLLDLIDQKSKAAPDQVPPLARLLPWQQAGELKSSRERLVALAEKGASADLREAGWAATALADGSFDTAWTTASQSPAKLRELLAGIPMLADSDFRAKAYAKTKPLLTSWPDAWQQAAQAKGVNSGRYVRVALPRTGTLTLAEVQVFSEGRNVALQGKARQSSTSNGADAQRAIDGRTDGSFGSNTQTHSRENENQPWWEVDLGSEMPVEAVTVWNRRDGDLGKRLEGFTLTILNQERREIFRQTDIPAPAESARIAVADDTFGSLRRAAIRASVSMNTEPAAIFSALGSLITHREEVASAARGLRTLPRTAWPKDAAGTAATDLVAWAKTIPSSGRSSQDYVETVQFANDLASFLPTDKAAALRKELKELRVSVFVIRTVREQMRYDTPRIVVEAGKPFELIIENSDFMPHNLVVVKPGSRDKVGIAAVTMKPDALDGKGRAYVPNSSDVLAATKLLESGQRATLQITAPSETGDYEYVCTFPGHHQVMWGWLIVTQDVDAYLQSHPEVKLPAPVSLDDH